ncbi:ABC-type sugar transport system substrate-binding protein [Mesorhizobium sangaii]|uniref:ABC-type sugar transport system substrate-binding protein n=1 Tax=Mesorhizobium sangaii TaxID=505389 RepID=A0A841PJ75_9HYPH|nr:ABC-type sugar transport system substrate-binding protein [Mesorhizobium sangaii]
MSLAKRFETDTGTLPARPERQAETLLRAEGLSRKYGPVTVLSDVTLDIAVRTNTAKFMIDKLGDKGDLVVLRGIPTVIDDDEAFKLMQDYLAKYPHIDAVWANDDDMLLGVLEAVKQSGRTDIKLALGGNGMKDIVEKVIDGDAMTPVETPYPPSMIKTAIYMTVANLIGQAPVRGTVKLDAPLITQANAKEYYFPDSPF